MNTFLNHFLFRKELRRLLRENAAQGEPLSVMDDMVFKAMLSSDTEDSREALRFLLSACIRREVVNVKVLNNELLPAHLDAKLVCLDIHVSFNDGEVADLEMQIGRSGDDLKTRAAVYAAMLQAGQARRGKRYKETKRAYQIFFLNCVLFPGSDKLPRRYGYREEREGDLLTDTVEIIFYELPKLEGQVREYLAGKIEQENLTDDEKWCIYMKWRHEQEARPLIRELCLKEEGIMRAEKSLEKVSRSYMKYAREMAVIKNEMERNARLEAIRQEVLTLDRAKGHAEGLEEGLGKGRAEGRAEGLEAVARKMKKSGRPLSEIAEFTGLPAEIIEALD